MSLRGWLISLNNSQIKMHVRNTIKNKQEKKTRWHTSHRGKSMKAKNVSERIPVEHIVINSNKKLYDNELIVIVTKKLQNKLQL